MSRVLAEGFDALFEAGLLDIFGVCEVEFCNGIAARLDGCLPDVVLLNATADGTVRTVAEIVTRHPYVTVITCSANDLVMRIYPPFHGGESYQAPLDPREIRRYLRA